MIPNKIKTHWNETWVPVSTKAPTKKYDYEISNYGRIKSISKETGFEKLLKGSRTNTFVCLNLKLEGNITQGIYIHKFVAEHFVKNDNPSKKFIIHKDNNKNNNYWQNLRWIDQQELTERQIEQGIYDSVRRLKTGQNKLSETKVRLIKQRLKAGKTKRKIIARTFNISETHLKRIESGENWSHVS